MRYETIAAETKGRGELANAVAYQPHTDLPVRYRNPRLLIRGSGAGFLEALNGWRLLTFLCLTTAELHSQGHHAKTCQLQKRPTIG